MPTTAALQFGRGYMYVQGADGISRRVGELQDTTVEVSHSEKELRGRKSFAIAVGFADGKISGKCGFAKLDQDFLKSVMLSRMDSGTVGKTLVVKHDVTGTVPTTPFTIAVTGIKSALGVYNVTTDSWMKVVTGAPSAANEVQVIAGTSLVFHTGASGNAVRYSYTADHATENGTTTLLNPDMGAATTFKLVFTTDFDGKTVTLILNKCYSNKLGLIDAKADFGIPNMDFAAMDDGINGIGILSIGSNT